MSGSPEAVVTEGHVSRIPIPSPRVSIATFLAPEGFLPRDLGNEEPMTDLQVEAGSAEALEGIERFLPCMWKGLARCL